MSLNVPTTFKITIEMLSDWHIGSGVGQGEMDSTVQRDQDGLPYIPGKTLTGILRDSCEQVALALDQGNQRGKWHNWINFLFGEQPALLRRDRAEDREQLESEPRPAVLAIHSAGFNQVLGNALQAKPKLKSAIAFIKPGVAIDPKTGSALPDFLRFEEVVRMGAILEAKACTFDFSQAEAVTEDQKKTAYALLIAGTKLCHRLGGKRRRGNGNCKIIINDEQSEQWIAWLQTNYQQLGEPPALLPEPILTNNLDNPATDANWHTVPLTLITQSPVVIPARTVGNVVESLDYIPGRYLLRHLHRQLGNKLNVSQAVARGNIVISNATISIDHKPSRPTPLCLFGEKLDGGLSKGKKVYNRFKEKEPDKLQLKGERGGYLGTFNGTELPEYSTVSLKIYTHNTIQDDVQRPTSDIGGVYSYQAIPTGVTFKAELRLPRTLKEHLDRATPNWWQELAGTIRIGQSKKDQYGAVTVKVEQPLPYPSPTVNDQELYVWFLSDVLLRDRALQPTTDPEIFKQELEKELDVTLSENNHRPDCLSLMTRSRRSESWQVRWGFPRPSMLGWQAGSCMVYQVTGKIAPEKLVELAARGIGERTAEGYGQISFNDALLSTPLADKERRKPGSSPPTSEPTSIPYNSPVFDYARTIETAAWREAIQNRSLAIASNPTDRQRILGLKIVGESSYPSLSQLGGLRSTLRRLQSISDQSTVIHWLEALRSIDNRREKWDNTENGLGKIRELIANPATVWQYLAFDSQALIITSSGRNELQQILWAEAVRTLIDAIIRGHKRDLEAIQDQEAA